MLEFWKNIKKGLLLYSLSINPTVIRFIDINTFLDNDKE